MKRSLTDVEAVALAVAVGVGAWLARPVPLVLAAATVVVALGFRRPWLLCIGGLLVASALGATSRAGLAPPAVRAWSGTVTLVADPESSVAGLQGIARADGRRYLLTARRGSGGALRASSAGEQLRVSGRIRPLSPGQGWLRSRHVVGRLQATTLERAGPGDGVWRAANGLRRILVRGTSSMGPTQRSLFTGFVLGDDRDQPVSTTDDFLGAGLTHLLAVSGENVAFVLTLAGPVLRRLPIAGRWAATLGVIAFFAVLTRFEPSVLRATVMAGIAATAVALGRPATSLRILALGVAALLLVDPLLVDSVGFVLSCSACAGIVLLGGPLAGALPGPRVVAEALAVTVAAQLGVAPVQLAVFGGLPVVSFPANLLAGPAAGLVMTWGLGAGIVAGVVGGRVATVLHLPTRLFIGWIELVARRASALPLGQLGWPQLSALGLAVALLLLGRRLAAARLVGPAPADTTVRLARPARALGGLLAAVALVTPAVATARATGRTEVADGVELWRDGAIVVQVAGTANPARALAGLREAGVRRVDLVVLSGNGTRSAAVLQALRHRWAVDAVWAPPGGSVVGARSPPVGSSVVLGRLQITVRRVRPRLQARVAVTGGRVASPGCCSGSGTAGTT